MTVQEILDNLSKVPTDKRHLEVIVTDSRNGCTDELSCSGSIEEVTGREDAGELCDWPVGKEYVRANVG